MEYPTSHFYFLGKKIEVRSGILHGISRESVAMITILYYNGFSVFSLVVFSMAWYKLNYNIR